jgi:hypothetical protein
MADNSTRPTYGNWRLPSRPGIGPLGLAGTVLLFGGLILALLTALISWVAAVGVAATVAMVIVPMAIRTVDGRTGFTVLATRTGWASRRLAGQDTYVSGPLTGRRFGPPGLLADLEMLEGRDIYSRRFGAIHDRRTQTYTVVLACDPDGGALVDGEQVDTWVASWGGWLASLAHEPGLIGASVVVETSPDPGTRLAAEVLPRLSPDAPESARAVLAEVVRSYPAASSETSTYVTLTYRPTADGAVFASRADRLADTVTDLATRIPHLAAGLSAAGGGPAVPVPAGQIAEAVRVAFDPSAAALVVQARAEDETTGLDWADCGPVTARETGDAYFHEDVVSRTWVASEAPRGTVRSGVLRGLLDPSPRIARKRVAVLYRPVDPASAARIVESDRRTAHFMAASTTGLVRARASTAIRAAEQAAAEEASGAGLVEFALVVTATVNSPDGLRAAGTEIGNLAAASRLRLRVARGQQAAAFATGLPAGVLPWLHTLVPSGLRSAL